MLPASTENSGQLVRRYDFLFRTDHRLRKLMDIDSDTDVTLTAFIAWFRANGGYIDLESLRFETFPMSEGGRGLAASKDIQEGHTLFSVPRHLALSTGTCLLPTLFGLENWKKLSLNKGWAGLILCMMWEQAKEKSSKWSGYLATLPDRFDTPMFWDENDLNELKGTAVIERIGKDEANQEYNAKILPALQTRMDLFPPDTWDRNYSLEIFHIMGSRILSRSFNVEPWFNANADESNHDDGLEELVDSPQSSNLQGESDDDEEPTYIAMVPMADMLNARFGTENSRLFHEENCLRMVATRPINSGDQIWNTYGDLPNSELLRRYGHIDLIPLPEGGVGNPGDVLEIRADIVVDAVMQCHSTSSTQLRERIDWWLDEGGDDVIVIESDCEVPALLLSLIRLLLLPSSEWEKVKSKSKPPKSKLEPDVLQVLIATLHLRSRLYSNDLTEDEVLLPQATTQNKRNAILVRMGEKRILIKTLEKLKGVLADGKGNKRKRVDDEGEGRAKRK